MTGRKLARILILFLGQCLSGICMSGQVGNMQMTTGIPEVVMGDMISTKDSGFIVAGKVLDNGINEFFIQKYDSLAGWSWTTKFNTPDLQFAGPVSERPGGGYFALLRGYQNCVLLALDVYGSLLWQQSFRGRPLSIAATMDSGAAVVISIDDTVGIDKVVTMLVKLDKSGSLLWARQHPYPHHFYDVQETNDGGLLLSGDVNGILNRTVLLMKTDAEGSPTWKREYPGVLAVENYRLRKGVSDNFIIGGAPDWDSTLSQMDLLYVNLQGEVQRRLRLYIDFQFRVPDFHVLPNGELLISGDFYENYVCPFTARFDSTGHIIMKRKYVSVKNTVTHRGVVIGGGQVVVGGFLPYLTNIPLQGFLIRTDNEGSTACLDSTFFMSVITDTPSSVIIPCTDSLWNPSAVSSVSAAGSSPVLFYDCIMAPVSPILTQAPALLYPQPSSDIVMLRIPLDNEEQLFLAASDGRMLPIQFTRSGDYLEIPLSHIPPGMYLLNYRSRRSSWSGKLIKY
ncbi:MAG: T9SS type A sorting domain-containing protein [Sphingobacteriales bacterium]|nr:MAG: T9SS type A sorting domain-containing protein [Sphingobacteriales bacterium]